MKFKTVLRFLCPAAALLFLAAAAPAPELKWQPWSETLFQQAEREKRFVILNLHATWCHWCHVMEEQTYRDPKVIALLKAKYLTVEVDADARPDLANRYEDYGWPATIVFNTNGREIVKRRGYIPPREMASMLQAIIDDPSPGPSVEPEGDIAFAKEAALPAALRTELEQALAAGYDQKRGSWGTRQKYLDWDNLEYCLTRALAGDAEAERMARQSLTAQLQLIDPAWGGIYQYSGEGDWKHPHFEKLIQFQAENLRVYALAYALWGDPAFLQTAENIRGYVKSFLASPDGAFYVSQNADLIDGKHAENYFELGDAARRKLGVPRVDTHVYSRENGWMIHGLAALYRASGQPEVLREAERAAEWIAEHRFLPGGGFRHDDADAAGPFLGDTLYMAQAFLDLYSITGERKWLQRAEEGAAFITQHFTSGVHEQAGLISSDVNRPMIPPATPQYDENVTAARFANLLFRYTQKPAHRALAECALRYLATPEIARDRRAFAGGVLLASAECAAEPLHVTVVGARSHPLARELFLTALRAPIAYKLTDWLDIAQGKLPYQDLEFPKLPTAAAFLCAHGACSAPIKDAAELSKRLPRAK